MTIIIFLTKILFSLIKTEQKIARLIKLPNEQFPAKLQRFCKKYQLSIGQVLVVNTPAHHAFVFGILLPKFVISTGLIKVLSDKQLESVLLHELCHLRRRHVPLLLTGEIMAATVFFFPIIKTLVRRMKVVCECRADAFVIQQQGNSFYLKSALAKVLMAPGYVLYPGFATFDRRSRLDYLFNHRSFGNKSLTLTVFVSFFILLVGVALWVFPTQNHALAGGICLIA